MAYRRAMQEETMRKGPWVEEEDERLATFVTLLGERRWDSLARASGLRRSGKSCRLRWMNYLRPDLKHGRMSMEEEQIIFQLHERWGNKWSRMARWLPGRTDNEIKNYWRTHLRKKAHAQEQENLQKGIDITAHAPQHFLTQEGAQNTQTSSFEYLGSSGKDDVVGTSKDSIDVNKSADYAFATSPYETHLSDWISGFSDDQIATEHQEERNTLDSLFCHPTWVSENGDDTWGYCSGSLWDME